MREIGPEELVVFVRVLHCAKLIGVLGLMKSTVVMLVDCELTLLSIHSE
jgi:hypothetical protein